MFDFVELREQMRKTMRARHNLDRAKAITARNAALSGYNSNADKSMLDAAKAALLSAEADLEKMREELAPLLQDVPDETKRSALYLRYIKGESVRRIAFELIYSERYMFRLLEIAENDVNKTGQSGQSRT